MPDPSSQPEFWDTRYAAGRTPWDFGGVPAPLTRWLANHPGHGARVLIPGCGTGHEISAFAQAGYAVTALDFSATAIALARAQVGPALARHVHEGDFFHHDFAAAAPFDVIYERTFLCALPPARWPDLAARAAALLRPGGTLVGIIFFGGKDGGPPFGLAPGEEHSLLARDFTLVADDAIPPAESLPLFAGRERWQERRRT